MTSPTMRAITLGQTAVLAELGDPSEPTAPDPARKNAGVRDILSSLGQNPNFFLFLFALG